jgi:hypothetical protein
MLCSITHDGSMGRHVGCGLLLLLLLLLLQHRVIRGPVVDSARQLRAAMHVVFGRGAAGTSLLHVGQHRR